MRYFILMVVAVLLTSCMSVDAPIRGEAVGPTNTLIPSVVAPTSPFENIVDAKNLPVWVDEFVHAYDGEVIVNGIEMNAEQLVSSIKADPDPFLQVKQIATKEFLFLVLDGVPLAMRGSDGQWQEATMAKLSELSGVTFEFSRSGAPDNHYSDYEGVLKKTAGRGSNFTFPGEMDTCRIFNDFSKEDWNGIIADWDEIKKELDEGKVPEKFPYRWNGVYNLINFVKKYVEAPQFRGQHLVELQLPSYCLLADSIVRAKEEQGFSNDDMLKILEFVVRTRVIKFPEVAKWDAEDEMIAANVEANTGGDSSKRFWNNSTGLKPAELTTLVAAWIKQSNPQAKVYVVEDVIFEDKYVRAQLNIVEFDNYVNSLHEANVQVDGIISENNFWIFAPPDMKYISQKIDDWNSFGFEIGGAETMIITGDDMINDSARPRTAEVTDRNFAQAELYRELLTLYLSKGIANFGFGGIDDYNAWTNDVGLPDANPLLFDGEFRAKPSYYAIVQVLYENLP